MHMVGSDCLAPSQLTICKYQTTLMALRHSTPDKLNNKITTDRIDQALRKDPQSSHKG